MSRRAQKPPVVKASNISLPVQGATANNSNHRASSVAGSEIMSSSAVEDRDLGLRNQNKSSQNMSPYPIDQSKETTYNAPEEPLRNAE